MGGGGGRGGGSARSAIGWQQRGQQPTQQHKHAVGMRGSEQKRSDGQSRREARSGTIITTAERQRAIAPSMGGGGGRGGGGARRARTELQSGETPK